MPLIVFNNKEYDTDLITKQLPNCHTEEVKTAEVLPSLCPEIKPTIAIKFNNQYHLLIGSINKEKEMVKLACITKHVLKRCEVSEELAISNPVPEPVTSTVRSFNKPRNQNQDNAIRRNQRSFPPRVSNAS